MSVPGLKETWYDFLSTKQAYIKFIKTAVLYVINMIISILGMKFTASEHKEHSTHFHVPVSDQSWVLTGNERVSEPENHLLILTGDMLRVPPSSGHERLQGQFLHLFFQNALVWTLRTFKMMSLVTAICVPVWLWMRANMVTNTKEQTATSKAPEARCLPVFRPPRLLCTEKQSLPEGGKVGL